MTQSYVFGTVLAVSLGLACATVLAQDDSKDAKIASPGFERTYLEDVKNIEAGKTIWREQCRHCHGRSAYPGKAPKLKPRRYKPDFVYDRITNGFRKMPAWKDVYDEAERKTIVAYILSKRFSP